MKRLLSLIVLSTLMSALPAAADWTAISEEQLVKAVNQTIIRHEWTTATDSTAYDISSCTGSVEARFDPSTGDASTDARVEFRVCKNSTDTWQKCRGSEFPGPNDGTTWISLNSLTQGENYIIAHPLSATTGGDTARAEVRCSDREAIQSNSGSGSVVTVAAGSLPGTGSTTTIYRVTGQTDGTDCDNVASGSAIAYCGWDGAAYAPVGVATSGLTNPLVADMAAAGFNLENVGTIEVPDILNVDLDTDLDGVTSDMLRIRDNDGDVMYEFPATSKAHFGNAASGGTIGAAGTLDETVLLLSGNLEVDGGIAALGTLGSGGFPGEVLFFTTVGTDGYIRFRPNASTQSDTWDWQIPTNNGDIGEFLQTDGSGVTDWIAVPGANVANLFGNLTEKSTPAIADRILIEDSAASYAKRWMAVGNLLDTRLSIAGGTMTGTIVIGSGANVFATGTGRVYATDMLGSGSSSNAVDLATAEVSGTLPVANGGTGITAFGNGVATALGVNVGSAGAPVVNGGALGEPSSGVATNLTGTAASLTAGAATVLAANGANCTAGSFPLGVDASGAVEDCTDAVLQAEVSGYTTGTSTPVDGSTACNTGDMHLETDAFKIYFCTDGATDKWYGVALSDTP